MMRTLLLLPLLVLASSGAVWADDEPKGGPEPLKHLKYRLIGPAAGGRVSRVAGVPGDPHTYYAAVSAGGVWKSSDGGLHWKPVFDDMPISSMGAVAVAPSDPNVVYAGSGEANIRGNVAAGNGIYRSTDAGKTWKHVWKQEGQIGQIVVHPKNADVAYAAVLGRAFGPNPERGLYRTTDGGTTWKQVLARDADTGAVDVSLDPNNPRVLFAALWQTRRRPWELTSGGPGSGLYVSRDGGDTWKRLDDREKGLPEGPWGRIGVAVAPSDGRRVYALIEAEKGGLFRSDDGGDSWKRVNEHRSLRQRPWYFSTITVDPKNPDIVWFPQVRLLKSIDGGKTIKPVKGPHHGDHHDLWIDPADPRRMIDANDGGVDVTTNGGETWFAPPLPIAQFYHINVDNRVPYHVSGCMQDLGTACGPSNSLSTAGIQLGDWHPVGGGETGHTAPDPSDPDIVYAGEYGGYLSRYDHRTRQARNVSVYPTNPSGHAAADLRYRFPWTAPVLVSKHDPKTVYHAANVLFRTRDGGTTWQRVSGDLSRNDRSKQNWSGGPITGDNTGVEVYGTIFALAESPLKKGLLWAGSDDGLVHVSTDDGQSWTNVTKNIPAVPEWGTVVCIEPSSFEPGTAYVVVDNHRMDDTRPYLWRTDDAGRTWTSLTARLPQDVYLHAVREDPKRRGLLFLGTERGVSFSTDAGATWQELKLNLPTVAVHDLRVKDNDLVVGTNGRSIWVFDDLTPIRELASIASRNVHLFPPQPATRWRYHSPVHSTADKRAGANPPAGAVIHYFLRAKPRGEVVLEVRDERGAPVARLSSKPEPEDTPPDDPDGPEEPKKPDLKTEPGVQRAVWNLRYRGAERIKGAKLDAGNLRIGPLAPPGRYTLRLIVDGTTLTETVAIIPDPRVKMSPFELASGVKFSLDVRDAITELTRQVERLRVVRKQLADRNELLQSDARAEALVKASQGLIERLDALEGRFHNPKAQVSYDILAQKGGAQLYSRLGILFDWAHDSDGPVTQGMREVFAEDSQLLARTAGELKRLLEGDIRDLNEQAQKLGLPTILVPPLRDDLSAALPGPVKLLVDEIDVPPLPGARPADLIALDPKGLEAYARDGKETAFRTTVARARALLVGLVQQTPLRESLAAPTDANGLRKALVQEQQEIARRMGQLGDLIEELKKVGTVRGTEASRRWQAHYDYLLARAELQRAALYEYQFVLAEMRREAPPRDPKAHDGWRLLRQEEQRSDLEGRKHTREAHRLLERIIQEHPGTPWAALARRDRDTPLGLQWQPARLQ